MMHSRKENTNALLLRQMAGVSSETQEWHTSDSDADIIPPSTRENQTSMMQKPCFSQIGHIPLNCERVSEKQHVQKYYQSHT